MPADALAEVARLARNVSAGQRDVVTDDAMLAGWLEVKVGRTWGLRFFQVRSGSLTSFACSKSHLFALKDDAQCTVAPLTEAARTGLRPDVACEVRVLVPGAASVPVMLCTTAQAEGVRSALADQVLARVVLCMVMEPADAVPRMAAVRVSRTSLYVFLFEDPIEYALYSLVLQATDEAVSEDFPFGLVVSSSQADQMFVPLDNLFLAAQSPFIILQWMGALRNADLEPQAAPSRTAVVSSGNNTRSNRSASGALLAQLVSGAVGRTKGSFSGHSEETAPATSDTEVRKADLVSMLKSVKWHADDPPTLETVLAHPDDQLTLAAFCKTIFTEENVNFCIQVDLFRAARDQRARQVRLLCEGVAMPLGSHTCHCRLWRVPLSASSSITQARAW